MGSLSDLLRYKQKVDLKNERDEIIATTWLRVIGDHDQQESYKLGRVASAKKRAALKDETSTDYIDEIEPFDMASREECLQIIVASRSSNFTAEAISANNREELPTLKDVAIDPDAPELEEQEKLELLKLEREVAYQKKLDEFVQTKVTELNASLESLSVEELRDLARQEAANILALTVFVTTVAEEKTWRAVYEDEFCKHRSFESVEEFRNLHPDIKEQLMLAYQKLEMGPAEIKNS